MILDLRPYGLGWEIDTKGELYVPEDLNDTMISTILYENSSQRTLVPLFGEPTNITLENELGRGTYGYTYKIKQVFNNMSLVCKVLDRKISSLKATILEFLIQLIIADDTKDIKEGILEGPFVPRVVFFAMNDKHIYIFSEAMDTTVEKYIGGDIKNAGPAPAGIMVDIIIQLSGMLAILHELYHFNHRDLKADNVMMKDGKVRLIDFGFSCLGKDHLKLNAANGQRFSICDKQDRDMSSFFFELLLFNYKDPKIPLGQIMRRLLGDAPEKWRNQYRFYNRSAVNELMTPTFLYFLFSTAKIENPADPLSKITMDGINMLFFDDNTATVLHVAARTNDTHLVKLLLAFPELKTKVLNKDGLTAYHLAALASKRWWSGAADNLIFDLLIHHNPSLASKKTPDGKTADELVQNEELRKYLASKKALVPALVRNTDKKLWGGKTKKHKRRTTLTF